MVVVDESWPFAGVSAEIAYEMQRYAFDYLDAPVVRVNAADTSLGYAPTFVEEYLPNPSKVIRAVKEVMYQKHKLEVENPQKKRQGQHHYPGLLQNIVDSENLMTQLKANDIDVVHDSDEKANIVIVNTCGFY